METLSVHSGRPPSGLNEEMVEPLVQDGGGAVPRPAGLVGAERGVVHAVQADVQRAVQVGRNLRYHSVAPNVSTPADLHTSAAIPRGQRTRRRSGEIAWRHPRAQPSLD